MQAIQTGRQAFPATRTVRTLAAAGLAGPFLFTAGFLVLGFVHPGYSPAARQISDLTAGPLGWAQQLNFVVFGLLLVAFAMGLQLGVQPARAGLAGPVLLGGNGLGLILAGGFPLRQDSAGRVYDPVGVHSVNGAIFFLTIGVTLVVLAARLRGDPNWRAVAPYTRVTGIVLLALFVAAGTLMRPAGAPLHGWLGLGQRLVVAVWMACLVVLAVRLRHIATQTGPASTAGKAPITDTGGTADIAASGRDATTGPPRWAKMLMLAGAIVLLLLFAIEHLVFERLPGGGMRHAGAPTAPAVPGSAPYVPARAHR